MQPKYLTGLITVGVMSAIALPVFSCGPPKRPEAQALVGSMNRAQQAFHLEQNTFAKSISELQQQIGLKSQTQTYTYSTRATPKAAFNYGISRNSTSFSYVGAVFLAPATDIDSKATQGEVTRVTILCRANSPGTLRPVDPTYLNGSPTCGSGTSEVYRFPS